VLFLLRPRQTYVPVALPRDPKQVAVRHEQNQKAYESTRRLPPPQSVARPDVVTQLKELAALHASGAVSDEEFTVAKAKVLDG